MERLIAIFVLSLIIIPIAYAQEITSAENYFTDYSSTWEIGKESPAINMHIGDDYFGFITQGGGVYRHYDKSGNLVWSSESLDFKPRFVNLNRIGDKIQIIHSYIAANGDWSTHLDFFDVNDGHFLKLIAPIGRFLLEASPSGKYYHNVRDELSFAPLGVYDEDGKLLNKDYGVGCDASALDDSLIAYLDRGVIKIIDVFKNEIINQRPVSEFTNNKINHYFIECSRDGQKLVLWSKWTSMFPDNAYNDIIILGRNLNLLGYIPLEGNIHNVSFSNNSEVLCCLASIQQDFPLFIIRLDGEISNRQNVLLPKNEKLAGSIHGLSFCDEFIAVRFTLVNKRDKKRYARSLIAQIDLDSKSILNHSIIPSRIFLFNNSNEFIEETENSVKIWIKEENNNE